jgi:hypothetical protein
LFYELSTDSTRYYYFLIYWTHGANMAVTLLADYIRNMMLSYQYFNVECPKEFWIQIDNCARKGKNSMVFVFLYYVVHYEWFNTVYVLVLFQGHIYHKMDQKIFHGILVNNIMLFFHYI